MGHIRRFVNRAESAVSRGFKAAANAGGNAIHKRTDSYHLNAMKAESAENQRQQIQARRARRELGY